MDSTGRGNRTRAWAADLSRSSQIPPLPNEYQHPWPSTHPLEYQNVAYIGVQDGPPAWITRRPEERWHPQARLSSSASPLLPASASRNHEIFSNAAIYVPHPPPFHNVLAGSTTSFENLSHELLAPSRRGSSNSPRIFFEDPTPVQSMPDATPTSQGLVEALTLAVGSSSSAADTAPHEPSVRKTTPKYECPACSKLHYHKKRVNACMNKHGNERPFVCGGECGKADCEKTFSNPETHSKHVQPRFVTCPNCGKRGYKSNMKRHERSCSKNDALNPGPQVV